MHDHTYYNTVRYNLPYNCCEPDNLSKLSEQCMQVSDNDINEYIVSDENQLSTDEDFVSSSDISPQGLLETSDHSQESEFAVMTANKDRRKLNTKFVFSEAVPLDVAEITVQSSLDASKVIEEVTECKLSGTEISDISRSTELGVEYKNNNPLIPAFSETSCSSTKSVIQGTSVSIIKSTIVGNQTHTERSVVQMPLIRGNGIILSKGEFDTIVKGMASLNGTAADGKHSTETISCKSATNAKSLTCSRTKNGNLCSNVCFIPSSGGKKNLDETVSAASRKHNITEMIAKNIEVYLPYVELYHGTKDVMKYLGQIVFKEGYAKLLHRNTINTPSNNSVRHSEVYVEPYSTTKLLGGIVCKKDYKEQFCLNYDEIRAGEIKKLEGYLSNKRHTEQLDIEKHDNLGATEPKGIVCKEDYVKWLFMNPNNGLLKRTEGPSGNVVRVVDYEQQSHTEVSDKSPSNGVTTQFSGGIFCKKDYKRQFCLNENEISANWMRKVQSGFLSEKRHTEQLDTEKCDDLGAVEQKGIMRKKDYVKWLFANTDNGDSENAEIPPERVVYIVDYEEQLQTEVIKPPCNELLSEKPASNNIVPKTAEYEETLSETTDLTSEFSSEATFKGFVLTDDSSQCEEIAVSDSAEKQEKHPTSKLKTTPHTAVGQCAVPLQNDESRKCLNLLAEAFPHVSNSLTLASMVIPAPSVIIPFVFEPPKSIFGDIKKKLGSEDVQQADELQTHCAQDVATEQLSSALPSKFFDIFRKPLGSYFIQLGSDIVTQYLQTSEEKQNPPNICDVIENARVNNTRLQQFFRSYTEYELKKCLHCNFKTESLIVLMDHLKKPHFKNGTWRCNFCVYARISDQLVVAHMLKRHKIFAKPKVPWQRYSCPFCIEFKNNSLCVMKNHVKTCKTKFKLNLNQRCLFDDLPARCSKSNVSYFVKYPNYREINKNQSSLPPPSHSGYFTSHSNTLTMPNASTIQRHIVQPSNAPLIWPHSTGQPLNAPFIWSHSTIQPLNAPPIWPHSTRAIENFSNLTSHVRNRHKVVACNGGKCNYCPEIFYTYAALQQHLKLVHLKNDNELPGSIKTEDVENNPNINNPNQLTWNSTFHASNKLWHCINCNVFFEVPLEFLVFAKKYVKDLGIRVWKADSGVVSTATPNVGWSAKCEVPNSFDLKLDQTVQNPAEVIVIKKMKKKPALSVRNDDENNQFEYQVYKTSKASLQTDTSMDITHEGLDGAHTPASCVIFEKRFTSQVPSSQEQTNVFKYSATEDIVENIKNPVKNRAKRRRWWVCEKCGERYHRRYRFLIHLKEDHTAVDKVQNHEENTKEHQLNFKCVDHQLKHFEIRIPKLNLEKIKRPHSFSENLLKKPKLVS